MIEKISAFDPEKNSVEKIIPATISANYNAVSPKWMAKIIKRQQVSSLMHKILGAESANTSDFVSSTLADSTPSLSILDRLKIQQKNLLHVISNLILNSSSFHQEEATISWKGVEPHHLIQWLKDKGYVSVAQKLESQTGYPWDEFRKIRSPILIEQLVDIYSLCHHKKVSQKDTQKFIDFALYLANLTLSSNLRQEYPRSYEIINDAKQVLGQLIYLINQDSHSATRAIDTPLYQKALENIKDVFSLKIQEICARLQSHYRAHYKTLLQDPEIALNTMIPVEIAKALLTDIGTINIGIIEALSDIFLSDEKRPINHEINLEHAFNLLQNSPRLRAEFEKIRCPHSSKTGSQDIIRITLDLPHTYPVTSWDTRLTALIALLSHLRQGEDRSCFAIALAIEILSAHLDFCVKDLRQILEEGKLTRCMKGIRKEIPFIKRINDETLYKKINFNSEGEIIVHNKKKAPLWQAPGLISACHSIGLEDPKAILLAIIHQLPPLNQKYFYKIEIRTLLKKLCEQAKSIHNLDHSLENLYNQACFAFSSQTSQPLLKIWENAIANMAEAEEGSMIKTAILESTLDALQFKLGELQIPPSLLLQRLLLLFQKLLYEKIRLQYDPAISNGSNAKSTEGGFVLYTKKQRIDNERSFRLFLLNILLEVNDKMKKSLTSNFELQEINQVLEILTFYIDTSEFIGYLLARYHPANKLTISKLSHGYPIIYEHLPFTPWITQTGNNSKFLLKIYFESEKPIQTEKFTAQSAKEALTNIIEICKRMSEDEKQLFLNNPNKLKPFCILGKHRLPFMAGHPSLANAWQQDYPIEKWIEQFVIIPGREIAETVIDKETKQNLLLCLQEEILPKAMAEDKIQATIELIQQISEALTIKQYRNHILKICESIHPMLIESLSGKLAHQIDTSLCQSLQPKLKKQLEDSAVHFADTNWCNGIQDLHFCFAVNPGTGELELWEAYANGTHLMALDQHYWLFNQKWEFLTIEDLIPDDSSYLVVPDLISNPF
jgi:hypothetical protein